MNQFPGNSSPLDPFGPRAQSWLASLTLHVRMSARRDRVAPVVDRVPFDLITLRNSVSAAPDRASRFRGACVAGLRSCLRTLPSTCGAPAHPTRC